MATTPTTIADAMNEKPVPATPGAAATTLDPSTVQGYVSDAASSTSLSNVPTVSAPSATRADTTGYTAAQAQATDWNVTGNQTVQQQLAGLINDNSPLLQSARTRALETANARGLLNSSMAAGAGEQAVINTALPIAQQDASTYADSAKFNAANRTQTSQFNTSALNDASKFGADAYNQSSLQYARNQDSLNQSAMNNNADMLKAVTLQKADAATRTALANLDAANRLQLQQVADRNKLTLQTSEMARQAMDTTMRTISAIQTDPNLTQEAKTQAIAEQYRMLEQSMSVADKVSGLNLSSVLDFTDNNAYLQQQKQTAAAKAEAAASSGAPTTPDPWGRQPGDPNYGVNVYAYG